MYNEQNWLRLLFLLADTQEWINNLGHDLLNSLPQAPARCKSKTYYLSITALAHIIERHYYRIERHPGAGKFTISIPEILQHIKDAKQAVATPVAGNNNLVRTWQTTNIIGYDNNAVQTNLITILTDTAGNIITAFPGTLQNNP